MRRAGPLAALLLLATAAFFWRPAPPRIDGEATFPVALDTAGRTTRRVVVRARTDAGAALVIPEGTRVSFPHGVPPAVSVAVVDHSPWILPEGVSPGPLVEFEPTGTRFEPGVFISLPNPTGLPEGTRCPLWGSDERLGGYLALGTATVSAEGVFESDGAIVRHFSTYFVELPFRVDTVGGNVVDDGTGAGIAGATVSVLGLSTTTGAGGEFLFDQLVPRTGWAVRLVVTAPIDGSAVTVTSADIIPPRTDVVIRVAEPAT
ncbi:MAG: hypothetical protein HY722_04060, partial [Planctomycetes bacterium]|nr:hypothetical protein [Planctomycetota bacterium]